MIYLDRNTYMMTLWFVRRYWRMKEEYQDILDESPTPNGIRGTGISNPTAIKQERVEKLHDDIKVIDDCLRIIPEEYRFGVFNNILTRRPYPDGASIRTYNRWKRRFIYAVAVQKGFQ